MADKRKVSNIQKKLQGHGRFVPSIPDVKPIQKLWKVPPTLGEHGRKVWRSIGALLVSSKVLTDLDKPAFYLLCVSYQMTEAMTEVLNREGVCVAGVNGAEKSHPAISVRKNSMNEFLRLMSEFGLSPKARSQLDLAVDKNPADPAREFLFGGGNK